MFKKMASTSIAVLLMATSISFISLNSALAATDADLTNIQIRYPGGQPASISGFSSNTTSYSVTATSSQVMVIVSKSDSGATLASTCNGTVIASDNNTNCDLNSGANSYTVEVTATDGTTKKTYTITFTGPAAHVISSSRTIVAGQTNPTLVIDSFYNYFCDTVSCFSIDVGTTGLTVSSLWRFGKTFSYTFSGTARAGTLTFQIPRGSRPPSNILSYVISGGTSASPSEKVDTPVSGFAQSLATQFLQMVRVQTARTTLLSGLASAKPGTLAQYAAAELEIKSEVALARVNAKVLALPVAKRSSTDEIAKIVKLENFVDAVSNSEIDSGTIAAQLVNNGFITADNRLKLSLANALRSRPASSIDSVEEIKMAIVEETARLQERVKRTAEIKAKIAARNK